MTATLDPIELGIQPLEAKQILDKMKTEVGISFERSADQYFSIRGSLSQINECQNLVQMYLIQEENISDKLSKFSLEADDVKTKQEGGPESSPAIKSPKDESTGVIMAKLIHEHPEEKVLQIDNLAEDDAKETGKLKIAEIQTFKSDSLAVSFMTQFYKDQMRNIAAECLVDFAKTGIATQVTLRPKPDCDPSRYMNACGEFLMLLNSASQGMAAWELELKDAAEDSAAALIQYITSTYPVIVDQPQKSGPFVVYGDAASVETVKLLVQGGMSGQAAGGDAFIGAQGMEMVESGDVSIETYNHCTDNGINISLRYGDITNEKVDAIVNPANSFLAHGAGLAKFIVQIGGREIQRESDKFILKHGKQLNVGDAVHTKAGNLPCRFIIHAVGPEWGRQSEKKTIGLLQKACFESLKLASKLGLSSVALPAISSGVYRAPIDVCAFAMLNGVEEFLENLKKPDEPKKEDTKKKGTKGNSQKKEDEKKPGKKKEDQTKEAQFQATGSEKDQEKAILHDIRFVLIDADAMDVFEEEFIKRFSGGKTDTLDDGDSV